MDKELGNEIFVAISSQKGGIGKSTITTLLSNYLHNVAGYNVGVLDCDHPQHSIYLERVRELELIEHDEELKAQACDVFRKTGKKALSGQTRLSQLQPIHSQLPPFRK